MRSELARSEYEKMIFDEIIRAKIKDLLNMYEGISLSALSRATGIPVPTLSRTLNGERKLNMFLVYKICTALKVPMSTFFIDIDDKFRTYMIENS